MSESTISDFISEDELRDEALDRSGTAKASGSYVMCAITRTKSVD